MMLRFVLAGLAMIGLCAVSSAFAPAPVYKEPPKPKVPDLYTAMQGTWEMNTALALGGLGRQRTTSIRIQGSTWSYVYSNNGTEFEGAKYEMDLNPTASPATLDLKVQNNGPAGGQVALKGILKVEGPTLTFCYVSGYGQNPLRPANFTANQMLANGTTAQIMTLKKVK